MKPTAIDQYWEERRRMREQESSRRLFHALTMPPPPTPSVKPVLTALLICEGSCNPQLPRLTESIIKPYDPLGLPLDDDAAAQLRSLVHTRHEHIGFITYACTVCRHERKY